jgi:hypothetical protein
VTNRSREQRLEDAVDEIIASLPLSDEHRELVRSFRQGQDFDASNADDARAFVDEWVKILADVQEQTPEFRRHVTKMLTSARLDHTLSFPETVLHRLADEPLAAISHIEARDTAISKQNALIAGNPRESRQDWWSLRICDCMEDDNLASPSDVKDYLLEISDVFVRDGHLVYGGSETHNGETVEPISMDQLRSKRRAALVRINKSSA